MKLAAANRRIVFLAAVFAILLVATLARAFWLQAVMGAEYAALAVRQHRETVVVPAARGMISDRNGDPLAIGEQAVTVYANPRQITKPNELTLAVSRALRIDPETIYPLVTDKSRGFVYLARKANPLAAAKLERLKLPGLGFFR